MSALPTEQTAEAPLTTAEQFRQTGVPAESAEPPVSQERMDSVAKAASAGLMAHPNVESAVVNICGTGNDLMFSLICVVVDRDRAPEVMDTVSHSVVPSIEELLAASFTSRHVEFMCGGHVLK